MSFFFVAGSALGRTRQLQQVQREAAQSLTSLPVPLRYLPFPLLPPKLRAGPRGNSQGPLPPTPNLDSCSFLTETAWVFMGLFYVKSW